MSHETCAACGAPLQSDQRKCPQCGADAPSSGEGKKTLIGAAVVIAVAAGVGLWTVYGPARNGPSKHAVATALDNNLSPVSSCEVEELRAQLGETPGASWEDQAAACREFRRATSRMPSIAIQRFFLRYIFALRLDGMKSEGKTMAREAMDIAARLATKDDETVRAALDALLKVYTDSKGRVTPLALNQELVARSTQTPISVQDLLNAAATMEASEKRP